MKNEKVNPFHALFFPGSRNVNRYVADNCFSGLFFPTIESAE